MVETEEASTTVEGARVVAEKAGQSEDAVLCVHGLASRRESLRPLVEVLAEEGFTALAPDLRGHGDSEGLRGRISQARALADLHAWSEYLAAEGARVRAIVGHSLGGLWAMAASEELEAEAIAAVATPVSIRHELNLLERLSYRAGAAVQSLASPFGLELRVPYQVDLEDVLVSEEAIQHARQIELVQRSLPLANVEDLLALDGERLAADVRVPAIVARPRGDELVEEASSRALFEALPERPRRWLEIEGPHECFFDVGGRQAADRVAEALEAALGEPG